jgi:hypothetical protein
MRTIEVQHAEPGFREMKVDSNASDKFLRRTKIKL